MEEGQTSLDHDEKQAAPAAEPIDHHSNVDTSRPFRSVKEAVAILGERFSVGATYSPKPFLLPKKESPNFSPSPKIDKEPISLQYSSPSPRGSSYYSHDMTLADTVKKLEAAFEETKAEIKLLKDRGSETEVALASLNAELHRNMSKLAKAEAAAAAKAANSLGPAPPARDYSREMDHEGSMTKKEDHEKKRDLPVVRKMGGNPSPILAQVLSVGEKEKLFLGRKKERKLYWMKKKPIIPLFGDLFSRKKGSSSVDNPLYASNSPLHLN